MREIEDDDADDTRHTALGMGKARRGPRGWKWRSDGRVCHNQKQLKVRQPL